MAISISEFIGLPYKDHGRDWDGIDCWGLVCLAKRELSSTILPAYEDYESATNFVELDSLIGSKKDDFESVEFGSHTFGDIITFRVAGLVCHVGFVLDGSRMLHTLEGHNSAVESFDRMLWKKRIDGVYRWKDS